MNVELQDQASSGTLSQEAADGGRSIVAAAKMSAKNQGKKVTPSRLCEDCGSAGAKLRRCTAERLCGACRSKPVHHIWTMAMIRRRTILVAEDVCDIAIGETLNPVDPRFQKQKIYRESDVLAREVEVKAKIELLRSLRQSSDAQSPKQFRRSASEDISENFR